MMLFFAVEAFASDVVSGASAAIDWAIVFATLTTAACAAVSLIAWLYSR